MVTLKCLLKVYEVALGECINFSKSAVLFSQSVGSNRKMFLSSILGVKNGEDLGNCHGVPSVFSKSKSEDFDFIMNKDRKAMQGWKNSFFSVDGKEILIKVWGKLPSYVMSIFKFPKYLCEEITRCFAQFWWGSNDSKKKMHWCKWKHLCLPKCLGGLNFRDVEGFNQATLVAKQVWRILVDPESLASCFLKSKYFRDRNIVLDLGLGNKPSYLWKSLLWGRELLMQGIRYRVGIGESISMFNVGFLKSQCSNLSV